MAFVDDVDIYYTWVAQQMAVWNPQRLQMFRGCALASDWPQLEIVDGGIYLLYLNSIQNGGTRYAPLYTHYLQWTWMLMGDDIQPNERKANRGDNYRDHILLQEDLRQSNFPGFAQKAAFTIDPVTGEISYAPYDPVEMLRWTELRMPTKYDYKAGIVYGTAALELTGYDAVSGTVNARVQPTPTVNLPLTKGPPHEHGWNQPRSTRRLEPEKVLLPGFLGARSETGADAKQPVSPLQLRQRRPVRG